MCKKCYIASLFFFARPHLSFSFMVYSYKLHFQGQLLVPVTTHLLPFLHDRITLLLFTCLYSTSYKSNFLVGVTKIGDSKCSNIVFIKKSIIKNSVSIPNSNIIFYFKYLELKVHLLNIKK